MGPIALPFQRTSMPPALPTFISAASVTFSVLVSLGRRTPEKICLPSLVTESQVASVAERLRATWMPSLSSVTLTEGPGSAGVSVADEETVRTGVEILEGWLTKFARGWFHHA